MSAAPADAAAYAMAPGERIHAIGKPTGQGVWLGPPITVEFKYLRTVDRTTADCYNRIILSTTLDATPHAASGLEVSVLAVCSRHSGAVGGVTEGRRSTIRERLIPARDRPFLIDCCAQREQGRIVEHSLEDGLWSSTS